MSTILMARFTSKAKAGRFLRYVPAEVLSDKSYNEAVGTPAADVVAACKRREYVPFENVLAPWFEWARRGGYEDAPLIEVVLAEIDTRFGYPPTYGVSYRMAIDLACSLTGLTYAYNASLRLLLLWADHEDIEGVIDKDAVRAFLDCHCGKYPSLAAAVEDNPWCFLGDDVLSADAWQPIGKFFDWQRIEDEWDTFRGFFDWQRIADELVSRNFYVLEGHVFHNR